jgi:hypothetical protein
MKMGNSVIGKVISRAAAGLSAGLMLACVSMILAAPLAMPTPTTAQTTFDSEHLCFVPTECEKTMLSESMCEGDKGCCVADRCFVPDNRCNTSASATEGGVKAGLCYARSGTVNLSVNLGPTSKVVDLGDYISSLYNYGTSIAAVVAALMIVIGGFRFLVSGDVSKASKGKENIMNAIIGLALVLSAYLILNTVNPELVTLRLPKVPIVKRTTFVGCSMTELCVPCGETYGVGVKENGDPPSQGDCSYVQYAGHPMTAKGAKIASSNCVGKSCYRTACAAGLTGEDLAKCQDKQTRCRIPGSVAVNLGTGDAAANRAVTQAVKSYDESNALMCRSKTAVASSTAAAEVAKASTSAKECKGTCRTKCESGETDKGAIAPCFLKKGETCCEGAAAQNQYVCSACGTYGSACSPTGQNEWCCSGYCGKDKCTAGQNGDPCNDDKDCVGGRCQKNWFNSCSSGEIGMPCGDEHTECKSGLKCQTYGHNTCSPGDRFSWCDNTAECASGLVCALKISQSFWVGISIDEYHMCLPPGDLTYVKKCTSNSDCQDSSKGFKYCNTATHLCTDGSVGVPCAKNEECAPPEGTYPNKEGWKLNGMCAEGKINTCTDGQDGAPCDTGFDCRSGRCSGVGLCTSGGLGSRCGGGGDKVVPGVGGCAKDYECDKTHDPHICVYSTKGSCPKD